MSRTNSNQKVAAAAAIAQDRAREAAVIAQDRARVAAARVRPAAAQVKPLAKSTQEAARRGFVRSRTWAAPRVERTGQVLQDNVAPKVADMLSSAAQRIEPDKPRSRNWWTLSGIAILVAAAAAAAAAALRKRSTGGSTAPAAEADTGETVVPGQPDASANSDAGKTARTP
jgi:hypothetical protein